MTCEVLIVGLPVRRDVPAREDVAFGCGLRRPASPRPVRGSGCTVEYVDLFSPEMGGHPDVEARIAAEGLVPPIVMVDGIVLSGGRQAQRVGDRACGRGRTRRRAVAPVESHPWLIRSPPTDGRRPAGTARRRLLRGACGPIFETPLLEQLFNRVRVAVSGRAAPIPRDTDRPAPGDEGWTTDD